MPKKTSGLKPGQKAPVSGQFQRIGPRGGKGPEVTAVKGQAVTAQPEEWQHVHARRPHQQ